MQIPVGNPMAGYPQPYATWAAVRAIADAHGSANGAHESAGSSAEDTTPAAYTVDVAA